MGLLSWLKGLAIEPERQPSEDGKLGPEEVRRLLSTGILSVPGPLDCTFYPDGEVRWEADGERSARYEIAADGTIRYKYAAFRLARRSGVLVIASRSSTADGTEVDWRRSDDRG